MSDTANLVLGVDSRQVTTGAKSLDDLAAAGAKAEKSTNSFSNSAATLANVAKAAAAGVATLAGTYLVLKNAVDAATKYQNALNGLASVARYAGEDITASMTKATRLTSDGLLSVSESATALKNLLSRGFATDQAVEMINRFKDAAAFGKQGSLEFGQAVVSATEGIKNENSVLVDNAGVTKNVSVMWKEYAASINKGVQELTLAEKRQAEYTGILRETEAQIGNAALAAQGMAGATARMDKGFSDAAVTIGQSFTPAAIGLTNAITTGLMFAVDNGIKPFLFMFENIGITAGEIMAKMGVFGDYLSSPSRWLNPAKAQKEMDAQFKIYADLADQMRIDVAKRLEGAVTPQLGTDTGARRKDAIIADKAATEAAEAHQKAIASMIASLQKEADTYGMTAAQVKIYEAAKLGMTKKQIEHSIALIEGRAAQEALTKAEEDSQKFREQSLDTQRAAVNATFDGNEALREEIKQIGMTREQIALMEITRLDETIAKKQATTATGDALVLLTEEIRLLQERRGLLVDKGAATAAAKQVEEATKQNVDLWKSIDQTAHDTFVSVANGNKDMWSRMKESGKNIFFDWLYSMTAKKWLISISAGFTGAGAAGTAGATGIGGGTSGMSLLQTGQTIWNGFSGGMASSMGSLAMSAGEMFGSAALTEFGVGATYAGAGGTIAGAAAGSTAAGMGAMVATAMPYIAAAVAIYSIAKGLGGGETRSGGMYGVDTGGQAKFIAGPSGGQISGTEIMQSINSTNTNINLLLGRFGSAATITGFAGYLESSTGGRGGAYAAGTVGGQRLVANVTGGGETGWGQSLTAGAAATQFADDLARLTLMALQAAEDIPPYLQKVFDSINPMTSSPQLINDTIAFADQLRMVRDALVETRTPLEMLRENVNTAFTQVGTSAETFKTDFIAAIDAGINPATLAQWQQLGAAIDQLAAVDAEAAARATETAARALVDALKLITSSLELALGDAKNILRASIDAEKNALQVQYEAQLTITRTRIDSITASVGKLTDLSSLLRTTVTSMAVGVTRQTAQAQISAALAAARTGGALPSAASLQDAIRKVSEPSAQMFGSYVDYMRDFVKTSNDISALADLTDVQLTEQEKALAIAEQQLEVLTLNYDASIARLDGIWTEATGIRYAVIDVATALANFNLASQQLTTAQKQSYTAYTPEQITTHVAGMLDQSISAIYAEALARNADPLAVGAAFGLSPVQTVSALHDAGIPGFATGINEVPFDMLANIHAGETITPKPYVDKERAARDETNALLRRLTASNDEMKKELVAIKKSNEKMWQIDDKWDIEGLPLERAA